MITMSKSLSVKQIINYYKNEYKKGDYFSEEGAIIGVWGGKGAEKLGLKGQVQEKDFANLAEGKDPRTEEQLIKHRKINEEHTGHRAGFDITFSAPKSISLTSLVGEDKKLIGLHEKAVSRAMQEVEQYAMVRNGNTNKDELTANLVYAKFTHETSRALDPQLHTHVVVMNASERQERGFRALQPVELYRSQELGTRIYYAELAKGLKGLGYEIEIGKSNGQPEIKGKSEEYLKHFSQRSEEIKQELTEKGLESSFYNRFNAAHETREKKIKDIAKENLVSWWKSRAEMFGVNEKKTVQEAITQTKQAKQDKGLAGKNTNAYANSSNSPSTNTNAVKEGVNLSIEHNLERNSVVDERELLTKALNVRTHLGKYTIDDVKKEVAEMLEKKELLQEQGEKGTRYTTKEMQDLEKESIAIVNGSRGKVNEIESSQQVKEALSKWEQLKSEQAGKEVGLNDEQRKVAESILTSKDQVIGIQGRAGVGKSFSLSFVKSEAERNGIEFRAFTPTTKAADNLRQDGIEANTVAKLMADLKNGNGEVKQGGMWVIDEAGMVDTRSMNKVLKAAQENQVRVVLVGDTRQHQAVGAGRAFDQLMKEGMQTNEISQIVRQKEGKFRDLVKDLSQGKTNNVIDRVKEVGNVYEIKDEQQKAGKAEFQDCSKDRYKKVAELYISSSERGSVLAVAPTNNERRQINEAVRAELKEKGEIAKEGVKVEILINKNITGAERKLAQNYEVGDTVGYLHGSKKHGVEPGEYAKVTSVDVASNNLTIKKNNGIEVSYNPQELYGIKDVYKTDNREFAIGDKIVFKEKNKDLDINSGNLGIVERLTGNNNVNGMDNGLLIKMDNGDSKPLELKDLKHTDHAYCMTSHKGQGTTVDSVIVYLDDRHRESMVNKTMAYVAISRARNEVNIVTNDEKGAQKAIEREYKKDVALDIKENSKTTDVINAVNAPNVANNEQKKEVSLTNTPKESNDNKKGIEGNSTSKNNDYRNIIEIEQEKHKGFYEYKFNDKELPGYEGYENKNNKLDVNDLEINEKSNTTNIIEEQITDNNNNNQQAPLISKENKNDISFGIE